MESANTTCGILLRWWNFSGVSQSDQAVSVEEVETNGLTRTVTDSDSLNQLEARLEHVSAIRFAMTGMRPDGNDSPLSILDNYLDERFDLYAIEIFEALLMAGKRWFRVTTESGKSHTGPLSHLCSIRLASLVALEPNRLFFFLPNRRDDVVDSKDLILFDLQAILPTLSARAWRQTVSFSTSQIAISKAHLFLFGNYLPDFIGNCVVIEYPSNKNLLGGSYTFAQDELPIALLNRPGNPERETLLFHLVRLSLLAVAAAAKKLEKNKFFSNKWLSEFSRRLVGPTSSRRLVGRQEYRQLTQLVQRESER